MLRTVRASKAFRFRVYPDARQVERLHAWQSALRFLWNIDLEQRRIGLSRCGDDKRYPTAFDQINELTALRAELPWLADVACGLCEHADLNAAKVLLQRFEHRANRSVLPGEASGLPGLRPRKRLRTFRRASESSVL
jgi:transposase